MTITAIIIAHNEINYTQLCIRSLQLFAPDTSIIVVDNHSSDGLSDWLAKQSTLSYASCPDAIESYSSLANQVLDCFEIDDYILFLNPSYLVSHNCIPKLLSHLHNTPSTALVGGIESICLEDTYNFNYEELVQYSLKHADDNRYCPAIGLPFSALLLRYSAWQQTGPFDENLTGSDAVWSDYQLRLHKNGFQIEQCPDAFLFSLESPDTWITDTYDDEYYLEKKYGMHYFNFSPNSNLTNLITAPSNTPIHVLEVGCDCGATLLQIKGRYPNATTYGLELNSSAAAIASLFADKVSCKNIEECSLDLPLHSLDYIIFGDVLEHLHNPDIVLLNLRQFLKEDGCIIASIPNLMHISVIESLLQGDFTYTEIGLLDKTHIHFFTYNEIIRMFHYTGFEIEDIKPVFLPLSDSQESLIPQLLNLAPSADSFMYKSFQYILRAKITSDTKELSK